MCNLLCIVVIILIRKDKIRKYGSNVILAIVVVMNLLNSLNVVFLNPTYDDKNICLELNELVGEKRVVGGFPLPFSFYNNIEVGPGAYNRYTLHGMDFEYVNSLYKSEVENNDELYFLGYASGGNGGAASIDEINKSILKDTDYCFEQVKYFKRHYYPREVGAGDLILYKKVLRGK